MSIDSQKAVAKSLLTHFYNIDPQALVAGGAPRDWSREVEAADVDIFIHTDVRSIIAARLLLDQNGIPWTECKSKDNLPEGYEDNKNIVAVFDYYCKLVNTTYQYIFIKQPAILAVESFPLAISQTWYNGFSIEKTPIHTKGWDDAILYVTNPWVDWGSKYLTKIRKKFPQYPMQYSDEALLMRMNHLNVIGFDF